MKIDNWDFSKVANGFDEYIKNQLFWYDEFSSLILPEIVNFFGVNNSTFYDIGCSIGNVELNCNDVILSKNLNFIALENNPMMIDNYLGNKDNVKLIDVLNYSYEPFSCATSILTLSFIHPSKREVLIENLKSKCIKGGCILILEKFYSETSMIQTVLQRINFKSKLKNKVLPDEVLLKDLQLSGTQFPLHLSEVVGFHQIYQFGEFRAFLYCN